jgi:hypothetical protein
MANIERKYQSAIDLLKPFSSGPRPHPAILLFLGEMYEKLDRPVDAAEAFGRAIKLWNEEPPPMPGNLYWKSPI